MPLLEVDGLSISFGGIQALADIDMNTDPEEILAVIGPNGSGKTTLFNCISGSYKPQEGEIRFIPRVVSDGANSVGIVSR